MRLHSLLLNVFLLLNLVIYGNSKRENFNNSIVIIQLQKKDTTHINSLLKKALKYRYTYSDSLYLLTNKALELSKQSNFLLGEAKAHYNLGIYYSGNGKHDRAIKNFMLSYNFAEENQDSDLVINSLDFIAFQFEFKGDYANALKYYLKGLELATEANNKPSLATFNANIATLYASSKIADKAMFYYDKAKKIKEELGDEYSLAKTICNIALLNIDHGEFNKALEHIDYSIKIFEKENVPTWLAYAYGVKGKLYKEKGNYNTALLWYKKSEKIYRTLDDKHYESKTLIGMSESYLELSENKEALLYIEKAHEISKKLDYLKGLQDCNKVLYLIHKKKGNFKTALIFYEEHQELLKNSNIEENTKSIALFEAENKYEKDKLNLTLENKATLARQRNYTFAFIAVLLAITIILIIVKRNEKRHKVLNEKLTLEQKKLKQSEAKLITANQTKTKLFSIIGHDLKSPIASFQQLFELFDTDDVTEKEFISFLPSLKEKINRINLTLSNLLQWGKTQIDGFVIQPEKINLHKLVTSIINLQSKDAEKKAISLVNNITPNTEIYADKNTIEIVCRNLVNNALKFTNTNGEVRISIKEKNDEIEVCVTDNGIGMSPEKAIQIFDDSPTESTQGTRKEKGTGLGLIVCKDLVVLNKGKIWVESSLGNGSSFFFTIPKNDQKN